MNSIKFIDSWIKDRNTFDKKTVIVVNRWNFEKCVELTKDLNDIAYISISATDDCARVILKDIEETTHYLKNGNNVLNLNFDDITEDVEYKTEENEVVTFKAITQEQARQLVDFVESNLGKHFIIHCRAGHSRSQGVARAIYDLYSDKYEICDYNSLNPCKTPNIDVVSKIKREFYKKHNFFE